MSSYIQKLILTNPLREQILRSAIDALKLPRGSHGLDVGCGIGLQTLLLANTVGPQGRVTGLDTSSVFLDYAKDVIAKAGISERVSFKKGDMNALPFEENSFDWLLSVDCAGYPSDDPIQLTKELARVVKPGGLVAILAWSSQQLLPGHARLEAMLNTTSAGIAPFSKATNPKNHLARALDWLHQAGLVETTAQTFVHTIHSPLDKKTREGLKYLLDMRWGDAQEEVSAEDWEMYQRLIHQDSGDYLPDHSDYYAFFTYSMFYGRVHTALI